MSSCLTCHSSEGLSATATGSALILQVHSRGVWASVSAELRTGKDAAEVGARQAALRRQLPARAGGHARERARGVAAPGRPGRADTAL